MLAEPDEVDRLNRNEARLGRDAARADEIPHSPESVDVSRTAKGGRGGEGSPAPAPQTSAPSIDAMEVNESGAEISVEDDDALDDINIGGVVECAEQDTAHAPVGNLRPGAQDEERVYVEDEAMGDLPTGALTSDNDEVGPAGLYE